MKRGGRKHKERVTDENVPPVKKPNLVHSSGTPAYRAKARRQEEQHEPARVMSCDLTNLKDTSTAVDPCVTTIGYEKLTQADLVCLQQERGQLNDRLINAGQILLKKRFPTTGGLQNVDLARTLCFTQNGASFVQILNTYYSYWVCY